MVFELIAGILLLVATAAWVYRDAKKNDVRYALGWAVLTFFSGLFGVLVYLAVERFQLVDELKHANSR